MNITHPLPPPPLRPGSLIGLFSPSGPVREAEAIQAGIRILTEMGYRVRHDLSFDERSGYLAGSDTERAEEFHRLWHDPEVHALIAVRGGYGCLRLLPQLDMARLGQRSKLLIGYSDLTVLLNGVTQHTGLMTLHGPMVNTLSRLSKASLTAFSQALSTPIDLKEEQIGASSPGRTIVRPGTGQGILRGGNLTTLVHLLGTPWEIPFDDTVLFLEEIGESAYRLDRMLTQLALSGRLNRLAGLVLGDFAQQVTDSDASARGMTAMVVSRVLELTAGSDFPILAGYPSGHRQENNPLLIGQPVCLNLL